MKAVPFSIFWPSFFQFPVRQSNSELAKLLWLIKLRWLAILFFALLSVPALVLNYLDGHTVLLYVGTLSVLFLFNLLTQSTWGPKNSRVSPLLICFQLSFDLVMLSILLSLMQSLANPLMALFLLNVSLGGILISGRLCWPFLLLAHSFLAILQFRFVWQRPDDLTLNFVATMILYHVLLFAFWLIMHSLGSYLEIQHERQARVQILSEKHDRLRAVGALAAGFSHEFASPLNAAKLRIERLSRSQNSDDLREALAAIGSCEQVIHQMNSSQLDVRGFQFKKILVADLLNDVVDSWREKNPQALIEVHIEDRERGEIPPINFAQVVLNLLDNAFEAKPSGLIRVHLSGSADSFRLQVTDEGPGVPLSVIEKMGEPFVTTKAHGTGLGLYVSQLFTQSLGGNLDIENTKSGAAVILQWPKQVEAT